MSEEQKAAMAAGRKKYFEERKLLKGEDNPEPKIKKESKRTMTPEHIAALVEGRRRAREQKIANGEPLRVVRKRKGKKGVPEVNNEGKPIVTITGKEQDAFDFFSMIRDAFRSLKRHNEVDKIIKEIRDSRYWNNLNWVETTLGKYMILQPPD